MVNFHTVTQKFLNEPGASALLAVRNVLSRPGMNPPGWSLRPVNGASGSWPSRSAPSEAYGVASVAASAAALRVPRNELEWEPRAALARQVHCKVTNIGECTPVVFRLAAIRCMIAR